jgi:peptidyl-prolyl cis-trans isomerase SurA
MLKKVINEVLEDQIIATHPEFVLLLKEYYEGILLFDIMEKEVWKKASEDSLGQQKYFELNEKKYWADERAITVLYSSGTPEMITTLMQYVDKNDSISIQKLIKGKSVRQEAGIFQKTDRPVLSKIEWKPGLYAVENSGISYLVQVKEMKPPGPLTFEEARASIISDYQDYLERTWLEQLKLKYPVKVNEKAKKYVVQELKP